MPNHSLTYNSDMEYLLNPLINYKIPEQKISKKDIKFYRKRILNLTKDLLYNKGSDVTENILLKTYNDYISLSIQHFKSIDAHDILQKEFADISLNLNVESDDSENENYDELIQKKIIKKVTMDKFVKKINKKQDNQIIPFQKKVDIDNPELKYKNCKRKE